MSSTSVELVLASSRVKVLLRLEVDLCVLRRIIIRKLWGVGMCFREGGCRDLLNG